MIKRIVNRLFDASGTILQSTEVINANVLLIIYELSYFEMACIPVCVDFVPILIIRE